jgi:hypothetical protein
MKPKPPLPVRKCQNQQCGIEFVPRTLAQVMCSRKCRMRKRQLDNRVSHEPRQCNGPTCEVVYTPTRSNQRFCCELCNRRAAREVGAVKPLRDAPRRARLARLYRRFTPPPQPQSHPLDYWPDPIPASVTAKWISPPRQGRA